MICNLGRVDLLRPHAVLLYELFADQRPTDSKSPQEIPFRLGPRACIVRPVQGMPRDILVMMLVKFHAAEWGTLRSDGGPLAPLKDDRAGDLEFHIAPEAVVSVQADTKRQRSLVTLSNGVWIIVGMYPSEINALLSEAAEAGPISPRPNRPQN